MTIITRRDSLTLGAGALAAAALPDRSARCAVTGASVAPPDHPIEKGATLRVARPNKFVESDETIFRQNTEKFSKASGVPVRVDFVGWEDLRPQTAVTANTGAGPDIVVGWTDDPQLYASKLIDLSELAEYLGKKYGGWKLQALTFGRKWKSNDWICIPIGGADGVCNYRSSWLKEAGFDRVPSHGCSTLPDRLD